MSVGTQKAPPGGSSTEQCLARSVADALAGEPSLEAVTIDRARKTIAVATLGRADVPSITRKITETFERAQTSTEETQCSLLAGQGDCGTCAQPLSPAERQRITISREGDATTIARV